MPDQPGDCVFLCADDGLADDEEDTETCVYLTIKLSKRNVSASSVLDGMCGAPGMAKLPDVISIDDFLLWRKFTPDAPPIRNEDLLSVLQVADLLSDKRIEAWASVLGVRAAATNWNDPRVAEKMHAALLSLPPNVLTMALQELIREVGPDSALESLPLPLHPFLIAAMITPHGELSIDDEDCTAHRFMPHMRLLPTPGHPPLQSLQLSFLLAPSMSYIIIDVLSKNTRLSHLHFALPRQHEAALPVMGALCPGLAAAPHLRELVIGDPALYTDSPLEALTPLARALPGLTALERLTLHNVQCCGDADISPPVHRVPTSAEANVHRRCWRQLLAAVAPHPCLTRLSLCLLNAYEPLPWPAAFPGLKELSLSCAHGGIPLVPVRPLTLPTHQALMQRPLLPDLTALSFRDAATAVIVLDRFRLPIGVDSRSCHLMRRLRVRIEGEHSSTEADVAVVGQAIAGALNACPQLEEFDDASKPMVAPLVCAQLCLLRSLTSLHLCGRTVGRRSPSEVAELADMVCGASGLQALSLHSADNADTCFVARALQGIGSGRLPALTRLWLRQSVASLEAGASLGVVEALRQRTALRAVSLIWCRLAPQDLWQALVAMPHLEGLGLHSVTMAEEDVRPLAEALRRMTALTCLDLRRGRSSGTLPSNIEARAVAELQQVSYVRLRRLRLIHSAFSYQDTPDDNVKDALADMNIELVWDSRDGEHL